VYVPGYGGCFLRTLFLAGRWRIFYAYTAQASFESLQRGRGATMRISTPYIKLDSLLKAENAVSSGGEAKAMISEGYISVNDEVEFRRGRKLYPGDRIVYGRKTFIIESS
jgi:ribosome-associated protein